MKLRPLHDRIIVKRLEEERKSAGGIVIPDTAAEKPSMGEVVAAGPAVADPEIAPRGRVARVVFDRHEEHLLCLLVTVEPGEDDAFVGEHDRNAGVHREARIIAGERLLKTPEIGERDPLVVERLGILPADGERRIECRDRSRQVALLVQGIALHEVRFGVSRGGCQNRSEARDRVAIPGEPEEGEAFDEEGVGHPRVFNERLVATDDCLAKEPEPVEACGKRDERRQVARVAGEDRFETGNCIGIPPGTDIFSGLPIEVPDLGIVRHPGLVPDGRYWVVLP